MNTFIDNHKVELNQQKLDVLIIIEQQKRTATFEQLRIIQRIETCLNCTQNIRCREDLKCPLSMKM